MNITPFIKTKVQNSTLANAQKICESATNCHCFITLYGTSVSVIKEHDKLRRPVSGKLAINILSHPVSGFRDRRRFRQYGVSKVLNLIPSCKDVSYSGKIHNTGYPRSSYILKTLFESGRMICPIVIKKSHLLPHLITIAGSKLVIYFKSVVRCSGQTLCR